MQKVSWSVTKAVASHDDIYTEKYYTQFVDGDALAASRVFEPLMAETFGVGRVADFGCGTGALLNELKNHGWQTYGFEYSDAAIAICHKRELNVRKFDLEKDELLPSDGPFDVVTSMEVAEHLPASCADRFVDLLTRLSSQVVFTAAVPGQGGRDHVNEQPHSYWIEKFQARGFEFLATDSEKWRIKLREGGASPCYSCNLMLFRRKQ